MKSTNTFGVQFVARKANSSSTELTIYARITVNKIRREVSLRKTLDPAHWDGKASQACRNREVMRKINPYIEEMRFKLVECYRELQLLRKPITADALKRLFLGEEEQEYTLSTLLAYHNTNMKDVLTPGTLKNYFTTERYVKRFIESNGKEDISLSELNFQFITEFELYLRRSVPLQANNPLTNNGIMKHMERLRKMVTLATKMEWLPKDPFHQYSLRFIKVDKDFLTPPELLLVEEVELSMTKLELGRDLFIFSCYAGLAYIDLDLLEPTDIVIGIDGEKWIHTVRAKTNVPVLVPLLPKAEALIEKYATDKRVEGRNRLFPKICNQKLNEYLRAIGAACNIPKHFSFHMARHTFATTVTLANGVPIETVSKMLGHTKLSTTQGYARVVETKISQDMKQLRNRLTAIEQPQLLKVVNA